MRVIRVDRPPVIAVLLAVLALSACNYPAEVAPSVVAGEAGIAGRLWHDVCAGPEEGQPLPESAPEGCVLGVDGTRYVANGRLDQKEDGIGGVEVSLGRGVCPSFGDASTRTEPDGLYLFSGLEAGTYCVTIDPASSTNAGILLPGRWTYPGAEQPEGVISTQIDLEPQEIQADVYFAWDYEFLPAFAAAPTSTMTVETPVPPQPTPTLTASPENTPTASPTSTAGVTPTPTLGAEDPRAALQNPTWVDDFQDQSDWALYADGHASFEIVEDGLKMTAFNPDFFNSWVLSWRKAENLYLETTGTFGSCADRDSFGLMIRSTGGSRGYVGYLFGISCDGRYSLRSWDGVSMETIVGWTPDTSIISGPEGSNRIGIWADGDKLSLYANGEFLVQVSDSRHKTEGLFGLFVSSAQTANFTTLVKEISFWNLD
ncbi:MAG: SdrD B-like domain-containing protein [Anaerolineales bacterium]|nr:SdrD B-like domain-containing protein [Anaerolineales bacterium]